MAAAVLTLALGIGAPTAIFTLIDAVMLRPLPVSDPSRLYRIGDGDDTIAVGRHGHWGFYSFPLFQRLKAAAPEFEDIAAFDWGGNSLTVRKGADDAARPLRAEYVTGTYFRTLGVGAFRGRVLAPNDDRPSAPPVVVLSHAAWQSLFGADPSAIGSILMVEDHPFTVIGVAARGFFGETVRASTPDLWIPLHQEPLIAGDGSLLRLSRPSWLAGIGRLRRGASLAHVAPRLTAILRQWIQYESDYPANRMPEIVRDLPRQTIAIVPAGSGIGMAGLAFKEQYGASLQILLAICGLVLLIACANVANLLLARAVARRTQTAIRIAIGASRRRILAEALAETAPIALGGALLGLLIAMAAARLLVALVFHNSSFVPIPAAPSLPVLAFTAAASLATAVLFGAAPAWFAARTDPIDSLRGSGRVGGRHSSRTRTALLAGQAALSVVLAAASTMLTRSLANLQHQDLGYPAQGRVLVTLKPLASSHTPQQLSTLYREITQRLAALPGVRASGLALYNPLTSNWTDTVLVQGHPPLPDSESTVSWDRISADYLHSLGVPLLRGRLFTPADNETAPPVALVNESFVKRFLRADEDPIDQRFGVERPGNAGTFRIIGVVRDAKFARFGLNQPPRPMFFVPLAQRVAYPADYRRMLEQRSHFVQGILLLTNSAPHDLEPRLRRTLAEAEPSLTITTVRTIEQQIHLSFDRERALACLAQVFGIIALLLAAAGVYGVTALLVAQQTNEIGIRLALGANPAQVVGFVLRSAFQCAAAGLIIGLPLAMGAAGILASQLYGVSLWDPTTLAVPAASLYLCTFLAAIIPARRAAAIRPIEALRAS